MKVTDLMVGDFVNVNDLPLRVGAIHQDELGFFDNDYKIYWCSDDEFDRIDPIPLTEDILVKNGFVYREAEETCATVAYHHWQLDGHWFALDYTQYFRKEKRDDIPRFDVAGIAIHYVHQLQHLLRLAGVQKEIEICPTKSTGRPTRPRWRKRCCRLCIATAESPHSSVTTPSRLSRQLWKSPKCWRGG